jgi:hypothetical protein
MRPMTRLFLGILVLIGILAVVAIGLPAHVTVARSVVINAPEYVVFPYLNDLHRFDDWSPWAGRDPKLKLTYSGPQEGKGARVEWASDVKSIGTGNMEIVESEPSRNIDLTVNYNGLDGTGSYDIGPAGSGSKVTWSFGYATGSNPIKRWQGLMLDGFVGAEYQVGLAKLKAKIEEDRRPTVPSVTLPPPGGVTTQPQQPSAALPPGQVAPGTPAPGVAPGALPPPGAAAPGAAAPGTTVPSQATTAPQAETPAPVAQPAPPPAQPKKKRRRTQR